MSLPLATIERLAARVAEPIESDEEIALAREVLEAASDEVRHYGRNWLTPEDAPAVAITITVAAAARGYLNPSGLSMERSDAVTFNRLDDYAAGTALTKSEQKILKVYSRRGGITSTSLYNDVALRHRSSDSPQWRGYAPSVDGTKPFPLGVGY